MSKYRGEPLEIDTNTPTIISCDAAAQIIANAMSRYVLYSYTVYGATRIVNQLSALLDVKARVWWGDGMCLVYTQRGSECGNADVMTVRGYSYRNLEMLRSAIAKATRMRSVAYLQARLSETTRARPRPFGSSS